MTGVGRSTGTGREPLAGSHTVLARLDLRRSRIPTRAWRARLPHRRHAHQRRSVLCGCGPERLVSRGIIARLRKWRQNRDVTMWPRTAFLVALLPCGGCADSESVHPDATSGTGLLGECSGFSATRERIVAISGGYATTCAAWSDGAAWCWGTNGAGELGYPSESIVDVPGQVGVSPCVDGIAAGGEHGCARMRDGTADCWGENIFGSLGNPDGGGPNPVPVLGIGTAVDVGARGYDTGALLVDGTIMQWGQRVSDRGEHAAVPVKVDVPQATALAVGSGHACAIASGAVWCWGSNRAGELGFEVSGSPVEHYLPAPVAGLADAVSVAVGYEFTCALLKLGTVACWGRNEVGQLGNGSQVDSFVPVQVIGVKDAVQLFANDDRGCAVLKDGSLWCWGDFVDQPLQLTAAQTSGVQNVTQAALGSSHTCVVEGDSTMFCWGLNVYGQLGLGWTENTYVATPTQVKWPWLVE